MGAFGFGLACVRGSRAGRGRTGRGTQNRIDGLGWGGERLLGSVVWFFTLVWLYPDDDDGWMTGGYRLASRPRTGLGLGFVDGCVG
jgi:hypothetical protein